MRPTLLGTDSLGRDVLSRLIYGARVAMLVAVFASLGAMADRRGARLYRRHISAAGSMP